MRHGIQSDTRAEPHVVADADRSHVEDGYIIVGQEVVAHVDIDAQVALETGLDAEIPSGRAKELAQHFVACLAVRNGQGVELLAKGNGTALYYAYFGVVHAVVFAASEFFYLFHFSYDFD